MSRGLGASLALGLLLLGAGCRRDPFPSARVLLIGIDGADPDILARLVGEGRLATLGRMTKEGAWGRLRSREPLLSPIVWTTIATGRKGQDHGILDFVERSREGKMLPITSLERRVPALWNVATAAHRRSGFVGWYGSFPAEAVDGFEVSDRLAFHQVASARATQQGTFPEALAQDLRQRFPEPEPDLKATRARFVAEPGAAVSADGERRLRELAKIHATTEFYRRIVPYLAERYRPELVGVYFELIDACGHLFMEDAPPKRPNVTGADFQALSGIVDRCYEYQDEVLGDLERLEGPDTVTLVCSDHGFKSGDGRPVASSQADTGRPTFWHRLHGVVVLHGKGVARGGEVRGATVLDVAPTVLALLRIPLSRELPGAPIAGAFAPGLLSGQPPPVDRYPTPPRPTAATDLGEDDARIEQLRALGYLGTEAGVAPTEDGRTVSSFVNEGSARAADGDKDGALEAYGRALKLDPRNVNARVFAARIYVERQEPGRAESLLEEALASDPRNVMAHLERAHVVLAAGRLQEAETEIRLAEALDERLAYVHLLRARLEVARDQRGAALLELSKAEALTDADVFLGEVFLFHAQVATEARRWDEAAAALARGDGLAPAALVLAGRGDLSLAQGDGARAAGFYGDALRTSPGDPVLDRKLGQALSLAGSSAEAEVAFRRALGEARSDADLEGAYGDLSLLLQGQGREAEARETLEASVARLPRSAALWGMAGAAWGRAHDLKRALQDYERSVAIRPTALGCKTLAALVFEERRDRTRALALWRQSLSLDPRQPDVEAFLRKYGGGSQSR